LGDKCAGIRIKNFPTPMLNFWQAETRTMNARLIFILPAAMFEQGWQPVFKLTLIRKFFNVFVVS
jgi:hypothetical protein